MIATSYHEIPLWNDETREQLKEFLYQVANTPLKVKILDVFLSDPGLCLSSDYLAERIGEQVYVVRRAAQQLCEAGAFNYCPYFAYTDLCSLSPLSHSEHTRRCLHLLHYALHHAPEEIWHHFNS